MYAICVENFKARIITGNDGTASAVSVKESLNFEKGMCTQIIEQNANKTCTIKIRDYSSENSFWDNNLFLCNSYHLLKISSDAWPFVIAIIDPTERLNFCRSKGYKDVLNLKRGDIVTASGLAFNKNILYDCIIKYIGLISEIGPGYYFGLELLNLDHGESPQVDELTYVQKYMSTTEPRIALVLAANWISREHPPAEKFSPKNFINGLICGAVDKAKDLDRQLSTRTSKKSKRHSSYVSENIETENNKPSNRKTFHSNSDKIDDFLMESNKHKKIAASISSPNLSKQDSSSSTGSSGRYAANNGLDNEELLRHMEMNHHEKNLDGRNSQTSSNSSTLKFSSKNKKKITNHVHVKPSTIMSLEDRDLIVIDKADIKESTSNESDVIIVDPPPVLTSPDNEQLDLKDLLGMNWPASAGDAASMLNTDKTTSVNSNVGGYSSSSSASTNSNYLHKSERNKSMNPISHLASTKASDSRRQKTTADASTMAKPNDTSHIYDNTNLPQFLSTSSENEVLHPTPLSEIPGNPTLGVGSMVEVTTDITADLYGVIRWIGNFQTGSLKNIMVGIELEEENLDRKLQLTDGSYNGIKLFRCPPGRGLFVHPSQCNIDRRFLDIDPTSSTSKISKKSDPKAFGQVDCPIVEGSVPPLKVLKPEDLEGLCGKFKGIQGHHNSCYLDATLFAMFTFTGVFDSLLFRPPEPEDDPHYEEVQRVLREEIVNPLRKNMFVRADRVLKLRQLLDKLSSVTGLMTEEKDPEEFLNSLLAQILRADPFLKLSSGLDTFYYQLFVEKDERLNLPSVQQLFEQSFLTSDIKLKEVPSCLIIQMPRFGKNFKMYPRILPSQVLDVTDIIEDSPRQCTVCGKLAEYECRECFGMIQCGVGLESTAFCKNCLDTAHSHVKRTNHSPKALSVPNDFKIMQDHCPVPRLFMELFAVVCIETSHYVAFVKAASGQDAPWCFFDSMADRKGEQNGYNIPEMVPVADLPQWLSEEGSRALHEAAAHDKQLPEHAKRLLCDAYMCMYQSTDVMMYR